ncbi:MAG: nucleoside phosphorylase [Chloroflexi bacterium]|nr:nucleoside phosphorylase [Chloroflexota bacterium]
MPFPNTPEKISFQSTLNAKQVFAARMQSKKIGTINSPQGVIFLYQNSLIKHIKKKHKLSRKSSIFFGDYYTLTGINGGVGLISNFGIGSPVTAVLVEELAAWGVKNFILVGLAGALDERLPSAALVVCDRTIRDEGTSHHYLPPGRLANPSPHLTKKLSKNLTAMGIKHKIGGSWTTDAPYRETHEEILAYRREGILTVEMEAAALFAVSQTLGLNSAAAFAIGDAYNGQSWTIDFDHAKITGSLLQLFDAALRSLPS